MHSQTVLAAAVCMVTCLTFFVVGCASSPISRTSKRLSATEIVDSLQEISPNGVTPDIAQQRMEENGFECTQVSNGVFIHQIYQDDGMTENRKLENIDFIRCVRKTQSGIWVTSFDEVALVIEDNVIVEVLANWSAVGP